MNTLICSRSFKEINVYSMIKLACHTDCNVKLYNSFIITVFFSIFTFSYLVSNWVDVPYYDEWRMVEFIDCWQKEYCTLWSLVDRDNNHIIFFEKLFELISYKFFRLDPRVEMLAGLMFIIFTVFILNLRIVYACDQPKYIDFLFNSIIAMLFLSLRNWENLLGPWSVNTASSTFFFILSVIYISGESYLSISFGILFCFLSSISFTNGLFAWPILLGYVLMHKRYYLFGIILLFSVLFFYWYAQSYLSFIPYDEFYLSTSIIRFLVLLGAILSTDPAVISNAGSVISPLTIPSSAIAGSLLLLFIIIIIAYLIKNKLIVTHGFSLSIMTYGLLSSLMIAFGRSNLGVEQVLSSRYYATAVIVYIGLILIAFETSITNLNFKYNLSVSIALFLLACVFLVSNIYEWSIGKYRYQFLNSWKINIINFEQVSDSDLKNPHFPAEFIRQHAAFLKHNKLHPF